MSQTPMHDAAQSVSTIRFAGRDTKFVAVVRRITNMPLLDAYCIVTVDDKHLSVFMPPTVDGDGLLLMYGHRYAIATMPSMTAERVTGLHRPCGMCRFIIRDEHNGTVIFDRANTAAAIESLLRRRVTRKKGSVR